MATRAKAGEGSLYKAEVHGRTVWRAAYSINHATTETHADGTVVPVVKRRKIVGTGNTPMEAVARREALLAKFRGEPVPEATRAQVIAQAEVVEPEVSLTIGELLDRWLSWKTRNVGDDEAISPTVAQKYARAIELHVREELGHLDARTVRRQDLALYLTEYLASKVKADGTPLLGRSPKRQIRNILTMAFGWAVREDLIDADPTVSLPRFSKARRVNEHLEQKRWIVQRIMAKIEGTDEEARWVLAIGTAIRQAERLGLTWSSFTNLAGSDKTRPMRMRIEQQLWRNPHTGAMEIKKQTKTAAGERIVPIAPRVAAVLRAYKKRQDVWKQSPEWNPLPGMEDLVFTQPNGRPITHQQDNRAWRALFDRCINPNHEPGSEKYVPPLRGHALRHIAISTMVEVGTPLEVLKVLVGHQSSDITSAVYTHLSWHTGQAPIEDLTGIMYSEADRTAARRSAVEAAG